MGCRFLIVWVGPFLVMFSLLLLLSGAVPHGNLASLLLHLAVVQHLLPAQLLLLQSPQALLLLLGVALHLGLANLLGALVQDRVLLLLVEALEVVGLHAVRGQHRLLRRRVLSHEVVVEREVDLVGAGLLARVEVGLVAVALLPRHLVVGVLVGDEHLLAHVRVVLLRVLQQLVVVRVQVMSVLLLLALSFLSGLLLGHLLFDPVLLL